MAGRVGVSVAWLRVFVVLIACLGASAAAAQAIGENMLAPADVLYVGDSESLGYFGDNIHKWVAATPDPKSRTPLSVRSFWTCGADVISWMSGGVSYCGARRCISPGVCTRDQGRGHVPYGSLKSYLAAVRPRVTIVSLGTNFLTEREFYSRNYYRYYLKRAQDLAEQIARAGSACIWVGPPQASLRTKPAEDYERFDADFAAAVQAGGCNYIDSNPLSDRSYVLPHDGEGIHYRGDGEKQWSAAVWKEMEPALKRSLVQHAAAAVP